MVVGVSATSLAVFDNEGMLLAVRAEGSRQRSRRSTGSKNPPAWVGMDVWGATICFNTVEAAKLNLPKPETWKDLTKPVYKGQIVMPNPASSGTGYLDVTGWLQMMGRGRTAGSSWTRCTRTSRSTRTRAASRAAQAGAGEFPIGISFEYRANHDQEVRARRSTSSSRTKAWAGTSRRSAS